MALSYEVPDILFICLNIVIFSGLGLRLGLPLLFTPFIGIALVALVGNVCVYLEVLWFKPIMMALWGLGLLSWIHKLFTGARQAEAKSALESVAFFTLLSLLFGHFFTDFFPPELSAVTPDSFIYSRFYNLDVLFRSALSTEMLEPSVSGSIGNPFYNPQKLGPYHLSAEAVLAALQLFVPHPNAESYATALWVAVVGLLSYLGCLLTRDIDNILRRLAFCMLFAFAFAWLGIFGRIYGLAGYFHYNSPSFFGFACVFAAVLAVPVSWSLVLFMLMSAAAFKTSFAVLIPFAFLLYLPRVWGILNPRRIKENYRRLLQLFIGGLNLLFTMSLVLFTEQANFAFGAGLRRSTAAIARAEFVSWMGEFPRRLLSMFGVVEGSGLAFLMVAFAFIWVAPTVFCIFLDGVQKSKTALFLLFLQILGAFSFLLIETRGPISFDPWLLNVLLFIPIAIIFAGFALLRLAFTRVDEMGWKPASPLMSLALCGILGFAIKPELNIVGWEKQKIQANTRYGSIIDQNLPVQAALFGQKIHHSAKNRFGHAFSVKDRSLQ